MFAAQKKERIEMTVKITKTIKLDSFLNRRNGKFRPDTIRMSIRKNGNSNQICVRIGEEVMRSQRWVIGDDKVEIEPFEAENGFVGIRMKRSISAIAKSLAGGRNSHGKMHLATVRFTSEEAETILRDCMEREVFPFEQDGWLVAAWKKKS